MCKGGDNRFMVYVANMFDPTLRIDINVIHYRHRSYYSCNTKSYITETGLSKFAYTLKGGYGLGFPISKEDECLEISIDVATSPQGDYCITAGKQAKVYFHDPVKEPREFIPPPPQKGKDKYGNYYIGGTVKLSKNDTTWAITIRKFPDDKQASDGPSPVSKDLASDDVTIGSEPPA